MNKCVHGVWHADGVGKTQGTRNKKRNGSGVERTPGSDAKKDQKVRKREVHELVDVSRTDDDLKPHSHVETTWDRIKT
jgi:hypothetical protein